MKTITPAATANAPMQAVYRFLLAEAGLDDPTESIPFDDFYLAWADACLAAWKEKRTSPTVTLPDVLFPHLAELQNPVTRQMVPIQRIPTFTY